jgi:uncharacterized membrane protein required for colicin V production
MTILSAIPWLDIFLGLLFVGLIALGFWQGLMKELWLLIALYLGAVLASLYGDYVAALIGSQVGSGAGPNEVASAWGFFIVIALATALFYSILFALVGHVRVKSRLLILDKIGGITLGVVTAFLLVSFLAYVINALLAYMPPTTEWAFVAVLKAQRLTSPLLHLFQDTRPVVMGAILPLLPGRLPVFMGSTTIVP